MDAAAYLDLLHAQGLDGSVLGAQAVQLAQAVPVQRLPGFEQGWVSVQDAHAQLAAPLLIGQGTAALPRGARVLDACAAPGGKTAHLLELADLDVLALDVDTTRLDRVRDTLARLDLQARMQAADAARPDTWWDGQPFDAILLDAPCSASGIVRRHPDVRWLRRPGDIDALAATQARLLDALWPLLRPGGRLVYATCSVFRAEGEDGVAAFVLRQGDARRQPGPGHLPALTDNASTGSPLPGGDGFFYAVLAKTA
jgi:16S rRNA (cytosine967-C5)-methyltransferase